MITIIIIFTIFGILLIFRFTLNLWSYGINWYYLDWYMDQEFYLHLACYIYSSFSYIYSSFSIFLNVSICINWETILLFYSNEVDNQKKARINNKEFNHLSKPHLVYRHTFLRVLYLPTLSSITKTIFLIVICILPRKD